MEPRYPTDNEINDFEQTLKIYITSGTGKLSAEKKIDTIIGNLRFTMIRQDRTAELLTSIVSKHQDDLIIYRNCCKIHNKK